MLVVVICLLISFIYGNESLCIRDVPILDFLLQIAKLISNEFRCFTETISINLHNISMGLGITVPALQMRKMRWQSWFETHVLSGSRCCIIWRWSFVLNEFRLFHPLVNYEFLYFSKHFFRLFFLYLVLSMFHVVKIYILTRNQKDLVPKDFSPEMET